MILVLALLVVPAIVLEEASSDALQTVAFALNIVIWVGFAAELAFVLAVASNRLRTLRTHWLDAVIVVVSVPLTPAFLQSARALRLLRLLRFVRLGLLGARALVAARMLFSPSGLRYVVVLVLLFVVVAGSAVAMVDSEGVGSIWDGIWWALATVTTVGYGDVVPHSVAGRIVAAVVMLVGIGFFALLTAAVAATFVKQDERPEELREELREISARLERIERALRDGC
ncbi:MAG TPA: potassium channel family protein [Gaiellaceae bacterium]|nr:potassium channel family protein [Gaiellaceae bacterium]